MISYGRQSINDNDLDAVIETLRGDWLTQGPAIEAFESAVAEYVGAKYAVAYSSGTSALHGAAVAAGLGPGDTLVTSPLTFMASANAARFVGAQPQLVDIEAATWNIDLEAVPTRATAVVPVHFAGLPVNLKGRKTAGQIIIEDAAHALGALTPDGPVGNCANSDMCCFSFHPVKPITTGEGGMVTTNDPVLANRLRLFRSHEIVRIPENGAWYYEISNLGFNYRMTDIQAALGVSQMKRLDEFMIRRNEIADYYRSKLASVDLALPPAATENYRHGYHLFAVLVKDRRRIFDGMREAGIGVQVHYVPVHHHPISSDIGLSPGDLPVCDDVYEQILSLPIHPGLSINEQDFVIETLSNLL
jgi:UDP-4-amino-4,6-dideoxy-N-acetyl-beta-L-altrosamine transaminase